MTSLSLCCGRNSFRVLPSLGISFQEFVQESRKTIARASNLTLSVYDILGRLQARNLVTLFATYRIARLASILCCPIEDITLSNLLALLVAVTIYQCRYIHIAPIVKRLQKMTVPIGVVRHLFVAKKDRVLSRCRLILIADMFWAVQIADNVNNIRQ